MAAVTRLVTVLDVDERTDRADVPVADGPAQEGFVPGWAPASPGSSPADPHQMSVSAFHLAVIDDGRRLTLLDDRGWTEGGPADIWRHASIEEVEETARVVVGPDEPYGSHTQEDMEADHWTSLAGILRRRGVLVDAQELSRLPHDVELSERLRVRLTGI